ncbi:hypothetical protein ACFV19_33825 [Streptomyces griseoluteus]|uniref:hypothetical protein n=1 Tax=Streptomyces griseoluteus TaxID=29306 RepID=UPI0036930B03
MPSLPDAHAEQVAEAIDSTPCGPIGDNKSAYVTTIVLRLIVAAEHHVLAPRAVLQNGAPSPLIGESGVAGASRSWSTLRRATPVRS